MTDKLAVYGLDQATMTAVVRKMENKGGPKIGEQFLPFVDSATEETVWDVLRGTNPLASFRAVDGESELVGRQAFDRMYADIQSIARKERFNTSDLRKIREAGMLPVVDGVPSAIALAGAAAKKKVADAIQRSKDAIDNRVEWMRINALLGKITSPTGSKVKFSVDYGIAAGQAGLVPTTVWDTVATATPLKDLAGWMRTFRNNTGVTPDTIIMSTEVMFQISQNTTLQGVMQYTNPLFSVAATKTLVQDQLGVNVILYDTTYTSEDGKTITRFLPQKTIIITVSKNIVPDGLGDTARVLHPLANYTPGYYFWSKEELDPYGIVAGVGLDAFPRIMHPELLMNADVLSS